MRGAEIERAAWAFRTRYGRDPRGGRARLDHGRDVGTKTQAPRVNVDEAWRAVGEEYGLTRERAKSLYSFERDAPGDRDLASGLLADVTRERSTVSDRDSVPAPTSSPRASHIHARPMARSMSWRARVSSRLGGWSLDDA